MSDQPKVSERMERLVIAYALTVAYRSEPQKVNAARCALLSAIAEIEQRAEKWKEVALAIREGALCARGFMLTKRVEAAFEVLGDEWDEAVKGEE